MENLEERQRIGDTIRQARKEKKITQKYLSESLKIRQDVISDYENGKIKVIPFEKRVKLASILDIPLNALLYTDEKERKEKEIGIDYISKEYDLLDSLMSELEADLEKADSVEKVEAIKARFEVLDKKRLDVAKNAARVCALIDDILARTKAGK
ncbi:helix-turn-helix domain-containing protein [Phascolarctobacterium succinatutens]|uniref:helix-turn-helix domain-containing protein n=1 Tax=Phascolarctobacterium succinatutens TaxID=626940 RepID=UPI0030773A7C